MTYLYIAAGVFLLLLAGVAIAAVLVLGFAARGYERLIEEEGLARE